MTSRADIRKILMALPKVKVETALANLTQVRWTDKGAACDELADLINSGQISILHVTGVPATAPVAAPAAAPVAATSKPAPNSLGARLLEDIQRVKVDHKQVTDQLRDTAQAHVTRLQAIETSIVDGGKYASETRRLMSDGITAVNNGLCALGRQVDAQAAALRVEVKGIKIDDAAVAVQVSAAVAAAFKPFAAAVAEAGAEQVIASMVEATVVRRAPCLDVFGVEVKDMKGNDVMVEVWDHPAAPAVDPHFIWSADILRHLLLAQDTGENLWLGGEKGTGKSETARQFAARTGRAFTRINFTKHSGVEDFIGATGLVNGQTVFEPKGFLLAFTAPSSVILLDEVTNTDPAELAVLNGWLEPNAAVTIGGKVWRRAAGVLCFAADNTLTNGDQSGRYAGTRTMNSALADRFARIIQFCFLPEDQEVDAVQRHTGCSEVLARHVVQAVNICRSKVETGDIIDAPSIRSVCAFIRALQRMPIAEAWATAVAARQPAESAAGLAAVYAATINEALIKANL